MLLHRRSIIIQVCLVLLATHRATSDEDDYSAENDYHSSEESGFNKRPDYSKYFNPAVAASGIVANKKKPESFDTGFIHPAEFESFFSAPLSFGEPNTRETAPQTFVSQPDQKPDPFEALRKSFAPKEEASETNPLKKDYFEESQKKQAEESSIRPGPYYVSHQIPVPKLYNDKDEERAQSKDDVETIPPPLKGKNKKKKPKTSTSGSDFGGYSNPYGVYETLKEAEDEIEQIEQTKVDPATLYGRKNVDYNTGKSSSTVSQYPSSAVYLANLQIPTTTLSPYQKYSFQPASSNYEPLQSKYLEAILSTASPLKNAESDSLNDKQQDDGLVSPSENVPEHLKNKDCRSIAGPENADNMNCFVCEDAPNKAKYTQCSYKSSQEPVSQYAGSSIRYSTPVKPPATLRYKRSPGKGRYSEDPYFEVSQRSKKYFDDYEKEQEAANSERQKDFHYKPYDPEEYESYSESQSSELLKEPGACKKVEREGSTCTVCKDPKTGGNFEQCSYSSAPKEHKYAYVAERKYDSDDEEPKESATVTKTSSDDPQNESSSASTKVSQNIEAPVGKYVSATKSKIIKDPIPELATAGSSVDETSEESPESEESDEEDPEESKKNEDEKESDYGFPYSNYEELKKDKKLVNDDPYDVPEHFAASVSQKQTAEDDDEENFDEYHHKIFPELSKEAESKNDEQTVDATEPKPQDVEEVLAEFAKKDRSNCKKAEKNGMTCFLCVDQYNVQHEECMYIAESKPRPTHIAYHEVQRLKDPKGENKPLINEESDVEESKKQEIITARPLDLVLPLASEKSKKKKFFKKAITTPSPVNLELTAAASGTHRTVVPFEKSEKRYSKKDYSDSKASGSAPDSERLEEDDEPKENSSEQPETPKEIDVGDEEGAYSHETKPVYSKLYGTTLPQYMVEKTEFEKEFDSASGF